jgi:hypothetical protein
MSRYREQEANQNCYLHVKQRINRTLIIFKRLLHLRSACILSVIKNSFLLQADGLVSQTK